MSFTCRLHALNILAVPPLKVGVELLPKEVLRRALSLSSERTWLRPAACRALAFRLSLRLLPSPVRQAACREWAAKRRRRRRRSCQDSVMLAPSPGLVGRTFAWIDAGSAKPVMRIASTSHVVGPTRTRLPWLGRVGRYVDAHPRAVCRRASLLKASDRERHRAGPAARAP